MTVAVPPGGEVAALAVEDDEVADVVVEVVGSGALLGEPTAA